MRSVEAFMPKFFAKDAKHFQVLRLSNYASFDKVVVRYMNGSLIKFLKAFFFNTLVVFFVNYLVPGIYVEDSSKIPHIRGDIIFPLVLGFLNSLILPSLRVLDQPFSFLRLAIIAMIINFAAYAFLKLISITIRLETIEGYLLGAFFVTVITLMISGWEMRKDRPKSDSKIEGVKFPE